MPRIFAILLIAVAPLTALRAQALIGEFGGGCVTLGPSSSTSTTLAAPIPANALVIASAALSNGAAFNHVVGDTAGNSDYTPAAASFQNNMATIVFSRASGAGMPSGTVITYSMQGGSGSRACLNVAAFSGVDSVGSLTAQGTGFSAANGATQSATSGFPTTRAATILVMEASYASDPGVVTPPAGGAMLTKSCVGAAPAFCMQSSYRVTGNTGTLSQSVTSQNAVSWQTALVGYSSDAMFLDGFE